MAVTHYVILYCVPNHQSQRKIERPVFGLSMETYGDITAAPGSDDIFTENIGGVEPGGGYIIMENLRDSADPGGDDF